MFELMEDHNEEAVIKVIGIGGGGGNAVEHMVCQTIEGVEFTTANTDSQALRNSSANVTLQLGADVTKGLGGQVLILILVVKRLKKIVIKSWKP